MIPPEAGSKPKVAGNGGFQAAKEGWLTIIASYPNLSGADLAVAVVISKHLNSKTRDAWPSLDLIAELTNREPSTVWRAVGHLKSLGLLEVLPGRGRTKVNRYKPKLGNMGTDPKTLRRRTRKTASSQRKDCEFEGVTYDEG
jgi:hypothetical protein